MLLAKCLLVCFLWMVAFWAGIFAILSMIAGYGTGFLFYGLLFSASCWGFWRGLVKWMK